MPGERDAREEAQVGPPGAMRRSPTSFSGVNRAPLNGVCRGLTDQTLILQRSSGLEVRSEEARRDGGSEGRLPGSGRNLRGQGYREQFLEVISCWGGQGWYGNLQLGNLTDLGWRAAGVRVTHQPEGQAEGTWGTGLSSEGP